MVSQNVPSWVLVGAIVLAVSCFAVSLFLPCLYLQDDPVPYIGGALFLWGPFGLFDGVVAWYANPFLALAAISLWLRKFRLAALCGIPALALALSTLAIHEILTSERPSYGTVVGYGPGFYLWIVSLTILPAAATVLAILPRFRRGAAFIPAELVNDIASQRTRGSSAGPA